MKSKRNKAFEREMAIHWWKYRANRFWRGVGSVGFAIGRLVVSQRPAVLLMAGLWFIALGLALPFMLHIVALVLPKLLLAWGALHLTVCLFNLGREFALSFTK